MGVSNLGKKIPLYGAEDFEDLFGTKYFKEKTEALTIGINNMYGAAEQLNRTFGQTRGRVTELMSAVATAVPEVDKLGGDIEDVFKTLESISKATRRNVIASKEDIESLYAAGRILGESFTLEDVVETMQEVGIQFGVVGQNLEKSFNYLRDIGMNTSQVMKTVFNYMEMMNKFTFQDGVVGLTKMAAQSSLLKFDMGQTFSLAEKALDPEQAIQLSAAFQRLGVNVGTLTNPFELMNKSLRDPQGLQDSLVEMTKRFTIFNEETKQFEITDAGKLMLREIESQTNLSAREMSKLALNVADVDAKFKALSPEIKFKNEEDRMYLANIAKMSEEGEYVVDVKGQMEGMKLEMLSQTQIDKLIEEQKRGDMSLTDVAKAQMNTSDRIQSDVRAIRDKVLYGIISVPSFTEFYEGFGSLFKGFMDTLESQTPTLQEISEITQNETRDLFGALNKAATEGDITGVTAKMGEVMEKLKEVFSAKGGDISADNLLENFQREFQRFKTDMLKRVPDADLRNLGLPPNNLEPAAERDISMSTFNNYSNPKTSIGYINRNTSLTTAVQNGMIDPSSMAKTVNVNHNYTWSPWDINIKATGDANFITKLDPKVFTSMIEVDEIQKKIFKVVEEQSKNATGTSSMDV